MKKYLLAILMMIFMGCSFTFEKERGRVTHERQSLSGVMEKSSKSNSEERNLNTGFKTEEEINIEFNSEENKKNRMNLKKEEIKREKIRKEAEEYKWNIFSAGYGRIFYTGKDINDIENYTFSVKTEGEKLNDEYSLGLIVGKIRLNNNFKYKESIIPGMTFGMELKGKILIAKISDRIKLSAGAGAGVGVLMWDYKNNIYSAGEVIKDDYTTYVKALGIIGLNYRKKENIYMNFEIIPEATATGMDTGWGFENDVFKNHFGLGYRVEIGGNF